MREKVEAVRPHMSEEILLPVVTRPEIFPAAEKYTQTRLQKERKRKERRRTGHDHVEEVTKYKRRGSCAAMLTFISY